jgi:hypothetical protein
VLELSPLGVQVEVRRTAAQTGARLTSAAAEAPEMAAAA